MGHQTSSISFPKISWQQFKKDGNRTIYHNNNGLFAQKKEITQDKKLEAKDELRIYKERAETDMPIVKVHNAIVQEEKKNFCSTLQKITVWIEYIPNRLSYIRSFSLNELECLYVLKESIEAFWQLFKRFGYFDIKPNMIGFNTEGHVKCWLNSCFFNNRIQNADNSVLSNGDTSVSSMKSISKMDYKLRQSIEKSMVADLWQMIKKKSDICNRELYYKLSNLETSNFQNATKLIDFLINKSHSKVPNCLYFENCLQLNNNKFREFSYGDVFNEESSKMKTVQLFDVELVQNGILNVNFESFEPNFKDFDLYREHIENMKPKHFDHDNKMNISFEKVVKGAQKTENPQEKKKHVKNALTLVDKTINISLSSIPLSPSHKTIQADTEPTDKKIESQENLFLPLQTVQRTYSVLVPNAVSQRYILNQIPSNKLITQQPMMMSSRKLVVQNIGTPIETDPNIMIPANHPTLLRKSTSRYVPPPPIPGILRRQPSIVGFVNEPNTPQFNKLGYH